MQRRGKHSNGELREHFWGEIMNLKSQKYQVDFFQVERVVLRKHQVDCATL